MTMKMILMTMKMILMTMKMATIAKLDSGRRFKAVQCPLQPDKDSKLRSNKDEDDCDKFCVVQEKPQSKHASLIINSYLSV